MKRWKRLICLFLCAVMLGRWYGPENMSAETTVVYYSMGKHANIYLLSNTYHITFDPLIR